MAKFLLVGDVHATTDELEDCDKLVQCIDDAISSTKVDYIVFMGDQFHTHAVLNVNVLNFWKETFLHFQKKVKGIICLVGNHDLPGNTGHTFVNSMSTLDHLCMVIDESMVFEGILFVGYQHDHAKFKALCHKESDIKTVVCHQTFQGATYENGFYAKDGIDLTDLPPQVFISGHIHTPQSFGNVIYIGAPRWRSISDAEVKDRYLVLFDSESGRAVSTFATGDFCRRKIKWVLTPDNCDYDYSWAKIGDLCYIDLIGPLAWLDTYHHKSPNIVVKKFPTDARPVKVKESEGIDKALSKFVDSYTTITTKDILKKMIEERVWTQK